MKEVKKNRSQEGKQISTPSPLVGERNCGRTEQSESGLRADLAFCCGATLAKLCEPGAISREGWVMGNYGLPRPHFVRPRNDETTCHAKRRIEMNLASQRLNVLASFRKVAKSNKKVAFTLAEVLITLGIIGIVAAMTLPALIQSYQKQVTVNRLKKTYSVIYNAVQAIKSKYDGVDLDQMPFMQNYHNHIEIRMDLLGQEFVSLLNPLSYGRSENNPTASNRIMLCGHAGELEGYRALGNPNYYYTYNTGIGSGHTFAMTLKDGTCITFIRTAYSWTDGSGVNIANPNLSKILWVYIDINGSKQRPNRMGKDTFIFLLMPNGTLLPSGFDSENWHCTSSRSAEACTAKIMRDGWQIKNDYPWRF